MHKPAMILCTGPEPYIDRVNGEELPEWHVYPADEVYTVRKSFDQAARLATRMACDRRLPLEMDACP